jgi:hypothetical protein
MNVDTLICQLDPAQSGGLDDHESLEAIFERVQRPATSHRLVDPHHPLARRALLVAAVGAVALGSTAVVLTLTNRPRDLRAVLVSAIERTTAANTARITVSYTDPSVEIAPGMSTFTGVVNFEKQADEVSYPNGYTMIFIGDQGWHTTWPLNPAQPWTATSASPAPTAAESQLLLALQGNTSATTLLAALQANADQVVETQPGQYEAMISASQTVTFTVANGTLTSFSVNGPQGSATTTYSDFGVPANIEPPTVSTPALNYPTGASGAGGPTGNTGTTDNSNAPTTN